MNLEEKINKLAEVRTSKAEANKIVKAFETEQKTLEKEIIAGLREHGIKSADSDQFRVTLSNKTAQSPIDWLEVWKWIIKHDAFELLPRKLKTTALQELKDQGRFPSDLFEEVPITSLSFRTKQRAL